MTGEHMNFSRIAEIPIFFCLNVELKLGTRYDIAIFRIITAHFLSAYVHPQISYTSW